MLSKVYRVALLSPLGYWAYLIVTGSLGADPAKNLNHKAGDITLYYLLLNLLIGGLLSFRVRWPAPLRFLPKHRRYLGVTTFIVLVCHVFLYLTMEGFEKQGFVQLVTKIYLICGFSGFLILFLLALTSNDFSVRRLGAKRWKRLHRFVYLASAFVTVHVLLIEKIDLRKFWILFSLLWLVQLIRLTARTYRGRDSNLT